MNLPPLNASQEFVRWPSFTPGEWIDFNPTVVVLDDGRRLGLIRRDRVPPVPGEGSIWSVWLDEELRPISPPGLLIARGEDPRAVVLGNRLYVFFVVIEKGAGGEIQGSCMMLAEFDATVTPPQAIRTSRLPKNPAGKAELQHVSWEKNWVPFVAGANQIALIYAHSPWTVLLLEVGAEAAVFRNVFSSPGLSWPFGDIRGGTPPLSFGDDTLITFFHAPQVIGSRNVYMTGACVFENSPPYAPRLMTREPLLIAPYRSTVQRFGWPVLASVIFPLGAAVAADGFRLLCGLDDGEIGCFPLKAEQLADRLQPLAADSGAQLLCASGAVTSVPAGPLLFAAEAESLPSHLPLARYLGMLPASAQTFVDLGAEEGLYAVYLSRNFARVIALESAKISWLRRNLAANQLSNVEALPLENLDTHAALQFGDVGLIRINLPDASRMLDQLGDLIAARQPLILIHDNGAADQRQRCAERIAELGYALEALFPLAPNTVICTIARHRNACPWML